MNLFRRFIKKHWLQNEITVPERVSTLPSTNVVDFQFHTDTEEVRSGTFELLVEIEPRLEKVVARDDGLGNLVALEDGILDPSTGSNVIDYENKTITITYDPKYLEQIILEPRLNFQAILEDDNQERHSQLLDLIAFSLTDYKEEELNKQLNYYNPEKIPFHIVDDFASGHNWVLDRTFSESEDYLRLQLEYMYQFYTNKRRVKGIKFIRNLLGKTIKIYNLLSVKGDTEEETTANYNDFGTYIRFDTDSILELGESDPTAAQSYYDELFKEDYTYFPTKHFLIEYLLDQLNTDGTLLKTTEIDTLNFYTKVVKAETQYPHYEATLGINSDVGITIQDNQPFDFLLKEDEQAFAGGNFEVLTSGPSEVETSVMTGTGVWPTLPLLMNDGFLMNLGLVFNMDISDFGSYLTTFQLGTSSHDTLTDDLSELKAPFFSSNNINYRYEGDNSYYEVVVGNLEANGTSIQEIGLFNGGGDLVFYIKTPTMFKNKNYQLKIKIKLDITAPTGI